MVRKLKYIFDKKSKIIIVFLLFLIVIGGFMEMLGVTAFYPFVEMLMDADSINNNYVLNIVFRIIGVQNQVLRITLLALGIILLYVVKNAYLIFMQNKILSFNYDTRMRISTRLLSAYMAEPYTFHLQKNSAELVRTLQTDTNQFMLLLNAVLQFLAEVVMCITIGAYLFYTSPSITIIVGVLLLVCVSIYYLLAKKVSIKVGLQNQQYNAKLLQWINQALGGIKEVKILEREGYFIEEYASNYRKLIKGAKGNELLTTIPKYITETVAIVGMLSAIIVKINYDESSITTFIPQLTAFAVAAFKLLPAVGKINAYNTSIMYCIPSLDVIYKDLKEVEEVDKYNNCKGVCNETKSLNEAIELHNITFCYPDSEREILKNVSFKIEKGKTVAFVGSSGAGKTTLADIVLGLLSPINGRVTIDGWDIKENMAAWHKMIGYIPQVIYLSDDSILKNVAFGLKENDIDHEAVVLALKKAQLIDFVSTLPDGINTYVGDRGVRLSGGQRQRIGIARALYHNPDILVLDEATSALDNETESAVMEAIDALKGEKTIIVIAHRLSTIKNADIVFEVADGIVKEKKMIWDSEQK